jgi:hypothetical protein
MPAFLARREVLQHASSTSGVVWPPPPRKVWRAWHVPRGPQRRRGRGHRDRFWVEALRRPRDGAIPESTARAFDVSSGQLSARVATAAPPAAPAIDSWCVRRGLGPRSRSPPMRTPILQLAVLCCAACSGSVVEEPGGESAASGGTGASSSTSSSTGTTNPTCALDGPCDLECCPGYVCTRGACQPQLADDRCWNSNFPATCDPRSAVACGAGTSCTLTLDDISVTCDGPAPVGDLGSSCDAASGCKPSLMCGKNHLCGKACCSAAECSAGQYCSKFAGQLGDLGVCGP